MRAAWGNGVYCDEVMDPPLLLVARSRLTADVQVPFELRTSVEAVIEHTRQWLASNADLEVCPWYTRITVAVSTTNSDFSSRGRKPCLLLQVAALTSKLNALKTY